MPLTEEFIRMYDESVKLVSVWDKKQHGNESTEGRTECLGGEPSYIDFIAVVGSSKAVSLGIRTRSV